MLSDSLEFLIAQYADGTLDSVRRAEVEAVLRRDSAARGILESYRSVDAALGGVVRRQPVPEVQWDQLQSKISRQVATLAGVVSSASMMSDDLEEKIASLADGSLEPTERVRVEAKLASDPAARVALAEYGSLEKVFETVRAAPLPSVQWDALANHISGAIDEQSSSSMKLVPAAEPMSAGVAGRIGWLQPRWLATAACVVIAASISFRLVSNKDIAPSIVPAPSGDVAGPTASPVAVMSVKGPGTDVAAKGPGVTDIQIGPPQNPESLAVITEALRDEHGRRQSRSIVASDKATVQDSDATTPFPR